MKKSLLVTLITLLLFIAAIIGSNHTYAMVAPVPDPEPEVIEAPDEEILSDFETNTGSSEIQEEEGADPSTNEFEAPDTSEQILEQFGE